MADDVGGISVKFTADASQLEAEISRLEQRLKTFDRARGNQKVPINAELTMPGERQVLDFRRKLTKSVADAGRIQTHVELVQPAGRALTEFATSLEGQIRDVKVLVKGKFVGWETPPPSEITMTVKPSGGGGGGGATVVTPQGGGNTSTQSNRGSATAAVVTPKSGGAAAVPLKPAVVSPVVAAARKTMAVTKEDRKATWTAEDLGSFSNTAIEEEMRHAKGADKVLMQQVLDQRRVKKMTRTGGYGGAREFGGGLHGSQDFMASPETSYRVESAARSRSRYSHGIGGDDPTSPEYLLTAGEMQAREGTEDLAARGGGIGPDVREPGGRARLERLVAETARASSPRWSLKEAAAGRFARSAAAELEGTGVPLSSMRGMSGLDVPTFIRKPRPVAEVQQAAPLTPEQTVAHLETHRGGLQPTLDTGGVGGGGRPPTGPRGEDVVGQPRMSEEVRDKYAGVQSDFAKKMQGFVEAGKLEIQEGRGAGQQRAIGTTAASQVATAFGRGKDVLALNEQEKILNKINKIVVENDKAFENLTEAQGKFAAGSEELRAVEKAVEGPKKAVAGLIEDYLKLAPNRIRQMAVGMTSAIGGTIVGMALLQTAMVGLQKAGELASESIDNMAGFSNEAGKAGKALGAATRQAHGFADVAVASAFAQSGMGKNTAASIRPLLEQRAATQAGNSALEDRVTLIKAAFNLQAQNRLAEMGLAPGPLQRPGAIPGISASEGGVFNSPLFAQTPLVEQVAELGPSGTAGQRAGIRVTTAGVGAVVGGVLGGLVGLLGGPFGAIAGAKGGSVVGGVLGLAAGGFAEELAGIKDLDLKEPGRWQALQAGQGGLEQAGVTDGVITGPISYQGKMISADMANQIAATGVNVLGEGDAGNPANALAVQRVSAMVATVQDLGEAAKRANPEIARQVKIQDLREKTGAEAEKLLDKSSASLRSIGVAEDQIESYRASRIAITGQGGQQLTRDQTKDFWNAAGQGSSTPEAEELARQMAKGMSAQLQMGAWQGNQQRQTTIPGQQYLRQLTSGRVNAQGDLNFRGSRIPTDVLNANGVDTSGLVQTQDELATSATRGRDALREMITVADTKLAQTMGPQRLLKQFDSLTASIGATAGQIRGLNRESQQLQLGVQLKQIGESIRVTTRALADAKSFISGRGGGALGLLQNQARALEIEQTQIGFERNRLSLGQNQRQINFQRAVAGFVTPGSTPEEIAARQEEARIEADFAQKQLNLAVKSQGVSEQQFGVGQQIIDEQAARAVTDLNANLALLHEQAHVMIVVAANTEAADALQEKMQGQVEQVQSVIDEAYGVVNTFAAAAAQETATVGGLMSAHMKMLMDGWVDFLDGIDSAMKARMPGGAGGGTWSGGYGGRGPGGGARSGTSSPATSDYGGGDAPAGSGGQRAAGFYGSVSEATQMTVGEAGTETIAILRNPRTMTMAPQGGGGGPVMINISGNTIGSQGDMEALAATVARKVEETMSRRASLLGMRTN